MRAFPLARCVYALGRMPVARREQVLTYLVLVVAAQVLIDAVRYLIVCL